jgi:hypothetical protein
MDFLFMKGSYWPKQPFVTGCYRPYPSGSGTTHPRDNPNIITDWLWLPIIEMGDAVSEAKNE